MYKPIVLVQKKEIEDNRVALIVDLNSDITDPLLVILQNIAGVDHVQKYSRYNLAVLIGKAFGGDVNDIILQVKEKCLAYLEVE